MTQRRAKDFFSASEQERIRSAAHRAEAGTSGEIATMVVDQSDNYPEGEVLGAVLASGLIAGVVAVGISHVTIWTYIPLVFLGYLPMLMVFRRYPRLKLAFVGKGRREEAVRNAAVRAFFEKGLCRTRDETGILIYISILERKVWILGDRGINERIDPLFWRQFASRLATGLHEGAACDALCGVISDCGAELARHFPHRPGDVNELTDHLIM